MHPIAPKPPLVTRFLHTGPALSDYNSIVHITTPNVTNAAASAASQATMATGFKPVVPTVCSAFESHENNLLEAAWTRLSGAHQKRAKLHYKRSTAAVETQANARKSPARSSPQLVGGSSPAPHVKSASISSIPGPEASDDAPSRSNVHRANVSSSKPRHTSNASEDDLVEDEDMVLNLELDKQPYIVPVGLDSLFTVDVRRLKLYPAFWHGPSLNVFRGEWFFASSSNSKYYPCEPELCQELEEAYDQIRPWDVSYEDEIRSALQIGTEAEAKLKFHLPSYNHDVIFQSPSHGRIYSTAVSSRLSKTILTNFFGSISRQQTQYSGGTVVVRGWDNICKWNKASGAQPDAKAESDVPSVTKKSASGNNTTADMLEELAQSYETFDFVHACNQLRLECNQVVQSDPTMVKLMKNKRAQFIPIRWRHTLDFEMEGFENDDAVQDDESDDSYEGANKFAMKDIQVKGSINFVREVITGLVLDVPLYMSARQHKLMIEAVKQQANKVYQLFCRRNSYYTGKKVSIVAHSLGAALTVDILSKQPTRILENFADQHHADANGVSCMIGSETVREQTDAQGEKDEDQENVHFCFNTNSVFLVGSPVAFFFHLHRAQLIARSPPNRPPDESRRKKRIETDEVGRYGCLAAEAVYNVYMSTDPVAYCMNAYFAEMFCSSAV